MLLELSDITPLKNFFDVIYDSTLTSVELKLANGGNVEAAVAVGTEIAKRALAKNIENVVFDRGGYIYHGRVKAVAEAAREAGLKF